MTDEQAIALTSNITELANGFSAVRFEGDDAFMLEPMIWVITSA